MKDERERLLNRRTVSDAIAYPGAGTGSNFRDLADEVSRGKLVEMMTDQRQRGLDECWLKRLLGIIQDPTMRE